MAFAAAPAKGDRVPDAFRAGTGEDADRANDDESLAEAGPPVGALIKLLSAELGPPEDARAEPLSAGVGPPEGARADPLNEQARLAGVVEAEGAADAARGAPCGDRLCGTAPAGVPPRPLGADGPTLAAVDRVFTNKPFEVAALGAVVAAAEQAAEQPGAVDVCASLSVEEPPGPRPESESPTARSCRTRAARVRPRSARRTCSTVEENCSIFVRRSTRSLP